ncbi:MAG: type IX secretion system membrane protein PorP/SprF [Bacteroidia bacterium]|nr:type IX secretion system membrane protein PorP/SprF [Bacteroidia bacterium]
MRKTTFFFLLFLGVGSANILAQDPEFTQFYANPLYLNPAFTGSQKCKKVCINYRNQWPALSGQFITTSVSYDQYICGVGGVGVLVTNDNAGEGTLRTINASLLYAWHQPITRTIQVSGGFQATYAEKRVDWEKLTFGDMIDPRHGFVYQTAEVEGRSVARYFDMSAGLLIHSPRYFIGFASHHLIEPDEFLHSGPSPLPRKYTGHAGALIPVSERDGITVSPNILYQMQGNFRQLNLGLYVNKGPLTGGFWYRDQDSFIVLLGLQKSMYRIGYSYDVTVSKLSNSSAGSHELSFQTTLACKKCKKKFRTVVCPSF